MSAPMDVLAVLATEIADIAGLSSSTEEGERRLREREASLRRARAAVADLVDQATAAERFVAGFEGDELQDGIDELLTRLRSSLAGIGGVSISQAPVEQSEDPHASDERYVEGLQR